MALGGYRVGAGRKPGSANQKTRELANAAAREGITPLEVMLKTMRALWNQAMKNGKIEDMVIAKEANGVAVQAAPYCHPKLSQIDADFGKPPELNTIVDPLALARQVALTLYLADKLLKGDNKVVNTLEHQEE